MAFLDGQIEIIAGNDDDLWFTSRGNDRLGRVTTAGAITTVVTGQTLVGGLTLGDDGNLWFGVSGGVARLALGP
jgi:virginiamycin B lyase